MSLTDEQGQQQDTAQNDQRPPVSPKERSLTTTPLSEQTEKRQPQDEQTPPTQMFTLAEVNQKTTQAVRRYQVTTAVTAAWAIWNTPGFKTTVVIPTLRWLGEKLAPNKS